MRIGMLTMRERIERAVGLEAQLLLNALHLRAISEDLVPSCKKSPAFHVNSAHLSLAVPSLFLSSRLIPSGDLGRMVKESAPAMVFKSGKEIAGFTLPPTTKECEIERLMNPDREYIEYLSGSSIEEVKIDSKLVRNAWEMIEMNESQLAADFTLLAGEGRDRQRSPPGVVQKGAENIWVSARAEISPQAALDGSSGPIWIAEGVSVLPFSYIEGPAYVGHDTIVNGAIIRGGTTVGPVCRVGGEVECTIFLGNANKAHGGFLGHSIVGEWVNLGAGTINSDLKNNYSSVKITVADKVYDTGMIKMGALIGDHVKTGIGTLINTGAVFGIGCNLFGGGIQPKFIPDFIWGGAGRYEEYRLEPFLETAAVIMKRRGKTLTQRLRALFETIFRMSASARLKWLTEMRGV